MKKINCRVQEGKGTLEMLIHKKKLILICFKNKLLNDSIVKEGHYVMLKNRPLKSISFNAYRVIYLAVLKGKCL